MFPEQVDWCLISYTPQFWSAPNGSVARISVTTVDSPDAGDGKGLAREEMMLAIRLFYLLPTDAEKISPSRILPYFLEIVAT